MILRLEYLNRGVTRGADNRWSCVIPNQTIYDSFSYEIHFINRENVAQQKRDIELAILNAYESEKNEHTVSEFIIPESNCFAWRFDDDEYDEDHYIQAEEGRGWRWKNFPPLGKAGDSGKKVDPRLIMEHMLRPSGNEEEGYMPLCSEINKIVFKKKEDGEECLILEGTPSYDAANPDMHLYSFEHAEYIGQDDGEGTRYDNVTVCFPYGAFRNNTEIVKPYPPISCGVNEEETNDTSYKFRLKPHFCSKQSKNYILFDGEIECTTTKIDDEELGLVYQGVYYWNASGLETLEGPDTGAYANITDGSESNGNIYVDIYNKLNDILKTRFTLTVYVAKVNEYPMNTPNGSFISSVPYVKEFEGRLFGDTLVVSKAMIGYVQCEDETFNWVIRYSLVSGIDVDISFLAGGTVERPNFIEIRCGNNVYISYSFRITLVTHTDDGNMLYTDELTLMESFEDREDIPQEWLTVDSSNALYELLQSRSHSLIGSAQGSDTRSVTETLAQKMYKTATLGQFLYGNNVPDSRIIDSLSACMTPWIPLINMAANENVDMKTKLNNIFENGKSVPPIPNFAIMGDAGTGKTTLAKRLAENCFGAEFRQIVGNELVAPYIGHDKFVVALTIYKMSEIAKDRPCVLFIDEAYTLFESNKQGNKGTSEVMEFILKLATPETRDPIDISMISEKDLVKAGLPADIKEVEIPKYFSIWVGGYKERLSISFQANEGLNRRFTRLVISTPKPTALMDKYRDQMLRICDLNDSDRSYYGNFLSRDQMEELIKEGTPAYKTVQDFIRWVSSPTLSQIFGNYAGINQLIESSRNRLLLTGDRKEKWTEAISMAVQDRRADVKERYKYSVIKEIGKLPFEAVTDIKETFKNYAGNKFLKSELSDIIDMMVDEELYKKRGISLPKGALLMGPPGTGKTFIARCMAGELQYRLNNNNSEKTTAFFPVSASELKSTANPVKSISALFASAEEYDYVIIFIDEIDAIGGRRELQHDIAPLIQLMKEMDGFNERNNIFVLAATNAPESLDAALKREGRFDLQLEVDEPDKETSEILFRMYLNKYNIDYENDFDPDQKNVLMRLLAGYTPAQVRADLNEAVLMYYRIQRWLSERKSDEERLEYAHRKNSETGGYDGEGVDENDRIHIDLLLRDLKETLDVRHIGNRKEKLEEEKELTKKEFPGTRNTGTVGTAIHEAGHALVGLLKGKLNIERITVLSRGYALGYVEHKRNLTGEMSRQDFIDTIMTNMGGRIAEEIVFGEDNISTGASADIQNATRTARNMVRLWGFSDDIGFMSLQASTGTYLRSEVVQTCSDDFYAKADDEVHKILKDCYKETKRMLLENKEILIALAYEVYSRMEMSGEELEEEYKKFVI